MKKILVLFLITLLVFSFVGCGSQAVVPSQGVVEDTIKVGTVGVQSGVLSFIGIPYFAGMEAYFKDVNDNGGVNDKFIELIKKDDEFNVEKSLAAIEELIYDDEVFAIVGHLGTPGVMASMDTVTESGIPDVYFGSGANQLTQAGENVFPVQPSYVYEGRLMSKFATEELNANKVVVIYQNDDVGRDGLKGFKDGLSKLEKSVVLAEDGEIPFNNGDADFTVQIQKAKAANPDVMILYGLSGGVSGILKECEKVGLDVPMITSYSNADASFLAIAAPGAPNVINNLYVLGWLNVNEESLKPLMDAMGKYFPDVPVNAYTMAGWVAAETFVAGLKETGDNLTWEGYVEAMNNLNFTEGLAPEISYSEGVRLGVTKMAMSKVTQDATGNYIFEVATDFIEFDE